MRIPCLLPTAALTLLTLAGCGPEARELPSVLVITLDTTRADHLGCYGYEKDTSPHLDALAAQSVQFDHALASAAVTPVSHASLFTGLEPYHHGVRVLHGTRENVLSEEVPTLAAILQEQGYRTGAFVSAFPVSRDFGFHHGFDHFDDRFVPDERPSGLVSREGMVSTGAVQRIAGDTVDRALEWLAEEEGPFFLWLHFFDPHDAAMTPPEDWLAAYPPPPADTKDALRVLYDMELTYMDQQIGRVLEALALREDAQDLVSVVTADHGEGLGDHDWWTHGILYQEQVRVPLLIQAPGAAPRNVDGLVRTTDVLPTLLDLLGLPEDEWPGMDGQSLADTLLRGAPAPASLAYSESINRLVYRTSAEIQDHKNDILFAISDGRWKLIHHLMRPEEGELYDLQEDPGELRNRYAERPEIVARLQHDLRQRDHLPSGQAKDDPSLQEHLEKLKALGYEGN